jgi:hypothetical protein
MKKNFLKFLVISLLILIPVFSGKAKPPCPYSCIDPSLCAGVRGTCLSEYECGGLGCCCDTGRGCTKIPAPDCTTYCSNPACFYPPQNQVCICNPLKAPDFETLVNNIISFLLTLALVLVPIIIIIGAYFIMTAGGDPGKVGKGKNIIIYSLIALVIILLAKSLVAIIKEILGVK